MNIPLSLDVSLQSMKIGWYDLNFERNTSIDFSLKNELFWYIWNICELVSTSFPVIEKGITKDYSYTEKGSYSYKYPNLSMTSKNGHYKVKGTINEKKDELTLYNFESLHFTPKTKDIVLRH